MSIEIDVNQAALRSNPAECSHHGFKVIVSLNLPDNSFLDQVQLVAPVCFFFIHYKKMAISRVTAVLNGTRRTEWPQKWRLSDVVREGALGA